jgi:uncharacterized membrane protein
VNIPAMIKQLVIPNFFLKRIFFFLLWLAIAIYAYLFIRQSFFLYHRYALTAYDLGIYDQAVWLISRFHNPYITVRGLPLLADHFDPILYLLAPLYWIWDSPKMLLVAQTLALAIGALPVYLIAQRKSDSAPGALMFAIAYLLYPALEWTNTFDFHPEIFATPFLLGAFYFLDCKRWRPYILLLALTTLTKETAGLSIIMLGLYALTRNRRIGWLTIGIGAVALFVALGVLQFYHAGQPSPYFSLYSRFGSSPARILGSIVFHPISAMNGMNTQENHSYLRDLFQPVLFLPLLAPEMLVLAFPSFLSNLLSSRIFMHMIYFQYNVYIIPFMFIASIIGFERLHRWAGSFTSRLFVLCLIANIIYGSGESPLLSTSWPLSQPVSSYQSSQADNILRMIPPEASVSAQSGLLPHITHRLQIYLFPNPFYPVAFGNSVPALEQQMGTNYPPFHPGEAAQTIADSKVDYIALQPKGCIFPMLPGNLWPPLTETLKSPYYGIIAIEGDTILLQRGASHKNGILLLSKKCGMKIRNEGDIDKAAKSYMNILY